MTPSPSPVAEPSSWPAWKRAGFRFLFAYVFLYYPVLVVNHLPGFDHVIEAWNLGWAAVVPWLGKHVLRVPTDFPDTTEGLIDVRYSYVRLACVALLATLATVVWSVADRGRATYARAWEVLHVVVRYGLANAMLYYGLSKVLPHQFGSASLEYLLEPLGARSRMGLLWTFMGESTPYTVFGGVAECMGGLLLLYRRTATLGALVIVAVMANVVALNFSYGVFVKLYAVHLWLMAVVVALPDLQRVWRALVVQTAVPARTLRPHFESAPGWERLVKGTFVAYLVGATLWTQFDHWRSCPRPTTGASSLGHLEGRYVRAQWHSRSAPHNGRSPLGAPRDRQGRKRSIGRHGHRVDHERRPTSLHRHRERFARRPDVRAGRDQDDVESRET